MSFTNTKFPPLPNPLVQQYNKHGAIPNPITIVNGNNRPITKQQPVQQPEQTNNNESTYDDELHQYYNDNTTNDIVYEDKSTLIKNPTSQPINSVFDLNKFIKK